MKKALRTMVSVVLAAGMVGCSSGSPSGTTPSAEAGSSAPAETAQSAETHHSSTVTIAVFSQFTSMDPATNGELVNGYLLHHMYRGLYRMDENSQPQMELATAHDISEDGLIHTFTLRDDAKWSDGTPVTASDFVYSYLRALSYGVDASNPIYNMTTFIAGAEEYSLNALEVGDSFDCTTEDHSSVGIEATDDHTLVLTLKKPCTYLNTLLCSGAWLPVHQSTPQHESAWALQGGYPCNGDHKLTEMNPNDKAVMVKNEYFYNADQITMDEIVWQVVPDTESQHLAFQAGDIDIATSITSDVAKSYKGTDELWVGLQTNTYCLTFNSGATGPEWAQNLNLRRAVAMAIDQKAVADVVGGEEFYPVLSSFMPLGLEGVDGDFREERDAEGGYTLVYNPEESKRLLAEEGYDESNPLKIEYYYSTNSIHNDVATCLQQMWSAVGIETTFKAVESGVYYEAWYNGDFEISRYGVALNHPVTALNTFTTQYQRVARIGDATYDAMVEDIQATIDPKEALRKCHEAEDYLVDEMAYIVPMFQFTLPMLKNPALTGQQINGAYLYFGESTWAE
ncbi:MAG: peptide ABC transporter substrate-binding protein [Solobacterium sp.]|nr:peptide ABC transporter substrate-binding protein [Solobacterium sp.]